MIWHLFLVLGDAVHVGLSNLEPTVIDLDMSEAQPSTLVARLPVGLHAAPRERSVAGDELLRLPGRSQRFGGEADHGGCRRHGRGAEKTSASEFVLISHCFVGPPGLSNFFLNTCAAL